MDTKERYGRYVLQSEDARTSAGSFYRAVQLGASGYERHVELFRSEMLPVDMAQAVADGLKSGTSVPHAQIVRGFEAGRIDKTSFAAYEMLEGRSVGALMDRSQTEGHPFAADHALLIVSKAAAALEVAQSKKQIHGFLIPEFIQVSHDGEVSVRGFGLPTRILRDANCIGVREARFMAPELDTNAPLDTRADIFSLGAQLLEMLTGSPLNRDQPTALSLDAARIPSPGSDGTPIPKALMTLLLQALAEDATKRYKDATTFKKAVDTLLFTGDYSPTTFNLAFFMHTLFRDEGDDDAVKVKAERTADYRAYLSTPSTPPAPIMPEPRSPAHPTPAVSSSGITHVSVPSPPPLSSRSGEVPRSEMSKADSPSGRQDAAKSEPTRAVRVPAPTPQGPTDDHLFQTVMREKKPFPIVPLVGAVILIGGAVAYFMTRTAPSGAVPPTAAATMNAVETAALARVRELESRLALLEAEKLAAETKAAEDAKATIEAQAKARGRAVDPAELQKAQDDARKKAQADQESRVQAERQKIEEERKKAEETRAAETAKAAADATPVPAATSASSPVFVPVPPLPSPSPSPSSSSAPSSAANPAGTPAATLSTTPAAGFNLLDVSDPGVTPPQLISQVRLEYPASARIQHVTGTVIVSALVDEHGTVVETRLIRGVAPNSGLNQAALDNVKKRKYKPATQGGKPGKAWVAIQIDFKL